MTYQEFIEILRPIKGDIVVILSACNSGSFIDILKASYANDEIYNRLNILCAAQRGVSACGIAEKTEEKSLDFYTYSLLLGLGWNMRTNTITTVAADSNGDGTVSFLEMAAYTNAKTKSVIKDYVKANGTKKPFTGNTAQNPQYFSANPSLPIWGK